MKRVGSTLLINAIVILAATCFGCRKDLAKQQNPMIGFSKSDVLRHPISSIELYSDGWDATSVVSIPPKYIVEKRGKLIRKIDDPGYIQRIIERLGHIPELEPCFHYGIDARVVCLLRNRNQTVDTLSFGGGKMMLNGGCYEVDTTLLKIVADSLPEYNQKAIRKMLDRM